MPDLYLRLALPAPLRRLFDYRAPAGVPVEQWQPGVRVRVPFGARKVVGILVEASANTEVPPGKIRDALELLDPAPLFEPPLLELIHWTASYYQHSLGDTFSWAMPVLLRQGEPATLQKKIFYLAAADAADTDERIKNAPRQREALKAVLQHRHGMAHEQLHSLGIQKSSIDALVEKGLLFREQRSLSPGRPAGPLLAQPPLALNAEQQLTVDAVSQALHRHQVFLLAGVTGSGKTEVYLHLIEKVLQQGRQVLVLIPEINLGPQTINRFRQRFNVRVALMHSEVSDRERLNAWLAARDGAAEIVIGTRSALFTPFRDLGLIVIDEEHDSSYKQQDGLRYHARDLAMVRARRLGIPVIMGSATPSLESLHNAQNGRYALLRLSRRAGAAQPPTFYRLDVRSQPLDSGISPPLQKAISDTLAAGQQVLVFLNRRGFAPVLMCQDCGWMGDCHACDARLTLHQRYNELRCHHCGHIEQRPHACPKCQSLQLHPVGAGTERAEERLQLLFPKIPVLRIDRDSTARKGSLDAMLNLIQRGEPCILLGTQMLAKGHHFPAVTLVAILNADGGLFSADFRAAERMAQQITQVAGRAGRAEQPGRVIIQSHVADHPLLIQLTEEGYFAFAEQALNERRSTQLPPFTHMALLRAEALNPQHAEDFLRDAASLVEQLQAHYKEDSVECLGPVAAPMERRDGRYRAQLLFISHQRPALHRLLHGLCFNLEQLTSARQVRWSLDVDPIDLY